MTKDLSPLGILAAADIGLTATAVFIVHPDRLPRATLVRTFADYMMHHEAKLASQPEKTVERAAALSTKYDLPPGTVDIGGFFARKSAFHASVEQMMECLKNEEFSIAADHLFLPRLRGKEGRFFSRLMVATGRAVIDTEALTRMAQAQSRQVMNKLKSRQEHQADDDYYRLENSVWHARRTWPKSLLAARDLFPKTYG